MDRNLKRKKEKKRLRNQKTRGTTAQPVGQNANLDTE